MGRAVRLTRNFESNLESLCDFLTGMGAPQEYDRLTTHLFDVLIPNLEAFGQLGRDFMSRQPQSLDSHVSYDRIARLLDERMEVREYIAGDYLVLYTVNKTSIVLLSIKHHRQLSFDLRTFWK